MGTHLHDTGEEAMLRDFFTEDLAKPASLTIGLFSDSTAALTDSEDVADLANEPTGTSYSRQTVSFGTTDFTVEDNANNNWQAVI